MKSLRQKSHDFRHEDKENTPVWKSFTALVFGVTDPSYKQEDWHTAIEPETGCPEKHANRCHFGAVITFRAVPTSVVLQNSGKFPLSACR